MSRKQEPTGEQHAIVALAEMHAKLVAWAKIACELLDTYPDTINGPRLVVSLCPVGPFDKPPKPKRRRRKQGEEPSDDELIRSAVNER